VAACESSMHLNRGCNRIRLHLAFKSSNNFSSFTLYSDAVSRMSAEEWKVCQERNMSRCISEGNIQAIFTFEFSKNDLVVSSLLKFLINHYT